jgi:FAD/FMN-containing dehydrogenase
MNTAFAQFSEIQPRTIFACHGPDDVAEALAQARGAPLAIRSGGHCFAGRSSTEGVLIDVSPMDAIEIGDDVVRVGAGARLGAIYDALSAHGLAIAAGCGPTVGISGLMLGGGLGILGRRYGLTSDQLVAAQAVLADGTVVECDEHAHADLFWALRGAGGCQFAVVTALTLRTIEAPTVTTVHLRWPLGQAAAVLEAWQEWAPDAPDEVAVSLLVTAGAVHAFGVGAEPPLPEPEWAEFHELPLREAKRHLVEHGPGDEAQPGAHVYSKSEFFRAPLPREAIRALLDHYATGTGPRVLDFSPWGGAYTRVPEAATAFAHRDERFLLKQEVVGDQRDWLRRSWAIVHPYGSGRVYPNFPDPELEDWAQAYHAGNLERLIRVKRTYDPDNVFRFAQSVQG